MQVKDKRAVRESYNALGGKLYDVRYETEQRAKYDEILGLINILDDAIVFDNGCGTGLLTERLKNPIVGIDLSYSLLSRAQSRSRAREGVHLVQGDSENLPLRSHVFEVVIAVTLIQNTPNPGRTLCEMKRVALTGSDIIVTALKKSLSLHDFKRLLNSSGLTLNTMIRIDDIKDWIALTNV
jgi:ubiquinone/menaquinone biosynthesis C-methylase UbiE